MELPSLSKGQVIVTGASVNTPVMLKVRTRLSRHGGQDIDAPELWRSWFEGEGVAAAQEGALFAEKKLNRDKDGELWA